MNLRSRVVTADAPRSRAKHRALLRRSRFSRQPYSLVAVAGMRAAVIKARRDLDGAYCAHDATAERTAVTKALFTDAQVASAGLTW
jgi:hypothetical protein